MWKRESECTYVAKSVGLSELRTLYSAVLGARRRASFFHFKFPKQTTKPFATFPGGNADGIRPKYGSTGGGDDRTVGPGFSKFLLTLIKAEILI